MSIVFLIGGTGNQLFQYAASSPDDRMSTLFLKPVIRRILGWTQHEQALRYEEARIVYQAFALVVLVLDLVLVKLTGRCLFTSLDARRLKASPVLVELVRLGYFQKDPERRSLESLAHQIAPVAQEGLIVLHIRGGDLLKIERAGNNVYGLLSRDYYLEGLAEALRELHQTSVRVRVLTDDPEYASTFDLLIDGVPEPEILCSTLMETLEQATGADWFISSNSTMSYWIVRLRGGVRSIAPKPFQKRQDYDLPDETRLLKVDF
jgi:hypothetical protein